MLKDNTYINYSNNIPNINSQTDLGQALRDELDRYIRTFEPKFLQLLFGVDFYSLFLQGLENDEQRMIDIKNMLIDETLNKSVIANYVFFYYAKVKKDVVFGVKDEAGNYSLNGVDTSVNVWNEMAEKSFEIFEFLKDNSDVYPEFTQRFMLGYINIFGI